MKPEDFNNEMDEKFEISSEEKEEEVENVWGTLPAELPPKKQ